MIVAQMENHRFDRFGQRGVQADRFPLEGTQQKQADCPPGMSGYHAKLTHGENLMMLMVFNVSNWLVGRNLS